MADSVAFPKHIIVLKGVFTLLVDLLIAEASEVTVLELLDSTTVVSIINDLFRVAFVDIIEGFHL
jgi:hypothetical protein